MLIFTYVRNTKLMNSQSNVFIQELLINLFHKSMSILGTALGEEYKTVLLTTELGRGSGLKNSVKLETFPRKRYLILLPDELI